MVRHYHTIPRITCHYVKILDWTICDVQELCNKKPTLSKRNISVMKRIQPQISTTTRETHDGKLFGWQNLLCAFWVLLGPFLGIFRPLWSVSVSFWSIDRCHHFCPVPHWTIQAVILTDDTSSACFSVGLPAVTGLQKRGSFFFFGCYTWWLNCDQS